MKLIKATFLCLSTLIAVACNSSKDSDSRTECLAGTEPLTGQSWASAMRAIPAPEGIDTISLQNADGSEKYAHLSVRMSLVNGATVNVPEMRQLLGNISDFQVPRKIDIPQNMAELTEDNNYTKSYLSERERPGQVQLTNHNCNVLEQTIETIAINKNSSLPKKITIIRRYELFDRFTISASSTTLIEGLEAGDDLTTVHLGVLTAGKKQQILTVYPYGKADQSVLPKNYALKSQSEKNLVLAAADFEIQLFYDRIDEALQDTSLPHSFILVSHTGIDNFDTTARQALPRKISLEEE